jgi:hypothetical protein
VQQEFDGWAVEGRYPATKHRQNREKIFMLFGISNQLDGPSIQLFSLKARS